ncbi:16S rRNA (guanine(966)-N(2))-methyltransferase RsmD [Thiomicrospira sp. R3]|uniref:16S rRNA (guanine(966)-N(2))-methyltransferase RsmD n=1 Tax=Thiomicrospira sp. R3 TaxID=3035472 RepID=UPI00259AFF6E|nr:16S rRNA (guanine(966)-N(2))-methyltransferase RsmD [Thiomicrospira sp. R3]WFE67832.1 16S rRNA (guanine(966)-N(2))-methyltransferase RsmD [Thiomicrospira sp. R3]
MKQGKKTNRSKSDPDLGEIRIIGGEWRGRKLPVVSQSGLRPTSDRMRETLFNWLQFELPGARCLDAFAGTGALGFEALSRGAASVVFVDKNAEVVRQLTANSQLLNARNAQVFHADSQAWLSQLVLSSSYLDALDIVFIDPPFYLGLVDPFLEVLINKNVLSYANEKGRTSWLYIEQEKSLAWSARLSGFELYREKTSAQTRVGLWRPLDKLNREEL